jgi:imidazolonepropionase-like amidohydrolase
MNRSTFLSSVLLATLAVAQAGAAAAAPLAIVNVRIEAGDGTTIERGTVVVDRGAIVDVGAGVKAPKGAEVIDGAGKTVTPGLVQIGSQIGLVEIGLEAATADATLAGRDAAPAFRALDGFNPRSPRVPIDRAQGLTTVVLAPQGGVIYGQGFAVDTTGTWSSIGGARRVAMFGGFGRGAAAAAGGARGGVLLRWREIFDDVRFYRDNRAAYDKAGSRALSLPRLHLEALIDVVEGRLPLAVDVHRESDIRALLRFAAEQRVRVVVLGGAEAWACADALARAEVPVVLQPSTAAPFSFEALAARDDAPRILRDGGVPLVLSGGSTDNGTTRLRQEAGIAVAYGLSREEALRAITATPARALGLDDRGTIAKGKRADLVVWSGDPFETSTAAEVVLIAGEKQSLRTRHQALAERYAPSRTEGR